METQGEEEYIETAEFVVKEERSVYREPKSLYKEPGALIATSKDPSGAWQLDVFEYKHGGNAWSYTKGVLTKVGETEPWAVIHRNYHSFWHAWATDKYLFAGYHYHGGLTLVDLQKKPPDNVLNYRDERDSWCIVGAVASPGGTGLACEGCHWGGPYSIRVYQFYDPFNKFVRFWLKRDVDTDIFGYHGCKASWQDDSHLLLTAEEEDDDEEAAEGEEGKEAEAREEDAYLHPSDVRTFGNNGKLRTVLLDLTSL